MCWEYLRIIENGKLMELHSWESSGIFEIQSSLPLTQTLTPINTTTLKWWTNIHKALTEALKIIYLKSEN